MANYWDVDSWSVETLGFIFSFRGAADGCVQLRKVLQHQRHSHFEYQGMNIRGLWVAARGAGYSRLEAPIWERGSRLVVTSSRPDS